jgi:23S rRNA pseudouridine1911/1915/1917 synthase
MKQGGDHMNDKLTFDIAPEQQGRKLVNYLKFEKDFSTRLTRKLIRNGYITLNGETAYAHDVLKAGDRIEVIVNTGDTQDITPENIPIEVAYEDDDLLIVNKPPFMVVHPTRSHQEGTLANAVTYYFRERGENYIVRLVNRIDRDTSGLVMIAKSQFAHQAMAKQMDDNVVEKYYIAVVKGLLEGKGTIDAPIDRPNEIALKREVLEEGYPAVTHYEALKSGNNMSSLLIKLDTGKTHQIRVHMSYIGHPIVGDHLYGEESHDIDRQALHAYRLSFKSLRTGDYVQVEAPIPEDMQSLIGKIERK